MIGLRSWADRLELLPGWAMTARSIGGDDAKALAGASDRPASNVRREIVAPLWKPCITAALSRIKGGDCVASDRRAQAARASARRAERGSGGDDHPAAALLHEGEELLGIAGREAHATMRGGAAKRGDMVGRVDGIAAAEEHGVMHRRIVIFA
jgi:hypothetical protein